MTLAAHADTGEISTRTSTAEEDVWITTRQATEILGRSSHTVYRLAKQGLLTMNRPGRAHARFLRSEVVGMARRAGIRVS